MICNVLRDVATPKETNARPWDWIIVLVLEYESRALNHESRSKSVLLSLKLLKSLQEPQQSLWLIDSNVCKMPCSSFLLRTAFRVTALRRTRFPHHHFTTLTPYRTSEPPTAKPLSSSKDEYDYSWIQDSEISMLLKQRDMLPKPSVYLQFGRKLDQFELKMREKIRTNPLLTEEDLEIVHKLRERLRIAEEHNLKRVRLFDEIIRKTVEEHTRIRETRSKRKEPSERQSTMAKKRL